MFLSIKSKFSEKVQIFRKKIYMFRFWKLFPSYLTTYLKFVTSLRLNLDPQSNSFVTTWYKTILSEKSQTDNNVPPKLNP